MQTLLKLKEIHSTVFGQFTYKTDQSHYEVLEKWVTFSDFEKENMVGDCEDFALYCRHLAREAGIDDTRLVLCKVETGEGHLVLEWQGWILDNRRKEVVSRESLPYTWVKISGYNPGDPWKEIVG